MKYKQIVTDTYMFYNSTGKQNLFPDCVNMFSDNYKVGIDSIIFSAYSFNTESSIKRIQKLREKCFILGDSGGFQILSGVTNYSDEYRRKTFEWLENVCDYSMLLDLPPYGIDFDYALKQSKDNFEYFKNNLKGKTKFLNIIHGNTVTLLQRWFEMMKQFDCFNGGWALGSIKKTSTELNCYLIVASLALLYKEGVLENMSEEMYLHILGTGSVQILFCAFYFLNRIPNFKATFSFDNSSISQYTRLKYYILNYFIIDKLRWVENYKSICQCPVCQCEDFEKLKYEPMFDYVQLYGHNYIKSRETFNIISKITKYDKKVFDELLKPFTRTMINVIDEILSDKENALKIISHYESQVKNDFNSDMIDDLF